MKRIFPVLLLAATTALAEEDLAQTYSAYGRLIVTQFVNAPFPHPSRATGFKWGHDFFPADKHYTDSTVVIFIPKDFRAGKQLNFVVHFHGWGNHVSSVLHQHQLIKQFAESGRNAVLVVPQGPRDASDSSGGKLEDPDGFKRFMDEARTTLRTGAGGQGLSKAKIGKIILSGHSGGYRAIAFILAQGGLTDHVREVWLFDGLYAQTDKFRNWFEHQPCRFLSIYTERGGTKAETEELMTELKRKGTPFCAKTDLETTPHDLQTNRLVFLHTDLDHNDVVNKRKTFCQFLKTSCLGEIQRTSKP